MKKLTKKLFLSVFTALFAVVALGTSTFAWFSMNTTVQATGMQAQAKADASLAIAKTDVDTKYKASISFTSSLTAPMPCAPKVENTYSDTGFYKLTAAGISKVNAVDGRFNGGSASYSAENTTDFMDAVKETDFLHETFYIKASDAMTVTSSVNLSANTKEITQALHVVVIADDVVVSEQDCGSKTTINFGTFELAAATAKKIDVYVWYDGNDSNCDNAAAVTAENVTLTFIFSKQAA